MVTFTMYVIGDLDTVLTAIEAGKSPVLLIFQQAVRSRTGAVLMYVIILIMAGACMIGCFATTWRMIWSFARDNRVPFLSSLVQCHNMNTKMVISSSRNRPISIPGSKLLDRDALLAGSARLVRRIL